MLFSIPVLTAFALGQDMMLLLLICGAAVLPVRRNMRFAAGMLLVLLTIKPHMFLMLPMLLIARKESRVLLGSVTGGAVLLYDQHHRARLELARRIPRTTAPIRRPSSRHASQPGRLADGQRSEKTSPWS